MVFYSYSITIKLFELLKIIFSRKYPQAYTPAGWTKTYWPTYTYAVSSEAPAPTASATLTYSALATTGSAAFVTNLPTVATCYTGSSLTAATLTTQAATTCPSTSYFCTVRKDDK